MYRMNGTNTINSLLGIANKLYDLIRNSKVCTLPFYSITVCNIA